MSAEQIAIWVPNDLNPASQTSAITTHMTTSNRNVVMIDVNTSYNNNFKEYYNQHIKQNEKANATFCSKNGKGINVEYLTDYANKRNYATLLSLDVDINDPTQFEVLAILVFRWSPTVGAVKIQAFCGNQKRPSKGSGTKLLNFLKKTLTQMGINNIYLNPVPNAVGYYSIHQFKNHPTGKIYDSSSPKSKTPSGKKTGTKSPKSKTKTNNNKIPTMTINLRSVKNWRKIKTKMSAYSALTRKTHGKTHISTATKKLLSKIDTIVDDLTSDDREIVQYQDMLDLIDRAHIKLNEAEENIVRKHLRTKYGIY